LPIVPILYASVTAGLVNLATHVIRSLGYAGVLAMTAMTGVISLPGTEPTMLFAGFNVYEKHLTLVGIIVFGVLGDMIGASIAYAIGRFGSQELIERQGTKLHLSPRKIERAHVWFERRGAPVIFISRLLPFVRAAFPYAAGIARMPYPRFAALATLGSIVWISALGILGKAVGSNWQAWRHHLEYADYAAVAIVVVAIVVWLVRRRRTGATTEPELAAPGRAGDSAASVDVVSR
jgi:membrane protein DedA with SNARE-associated domain